MYLSKRYPCSIPKLCLFYPVQGYYLFSVSLPRCSISSSASLRSTARLRSSESPSSVRHRRSLPFAAPWRIPMIPPKKHPLSNFFLNLYPMSPTAIVADGVDLFSFLFFFCVASLTLIDFLVAFVLTAFFFAVFLLFDAVLSVLFGQMKVNILYE